MPLSLRGRGVMVVFNDPVPVENPALQAVLMAIELREAIGALTATWSRLVARPLKLSSRCLRLGSRFSARSSVWSPAANTAISYRSSLYLFHSRRAHPAIRLSAGEEAIELCERHEFVVRQASGFIR